MPAENGYVPTPAPVADWVARTVFADSPSEGDRLLLPGVGDGSLYAAVRRYCSVRGQPLPDAVAIDNDPERLAELHERFPNPDQPSVPTFPDGSRWFHRPLALEGGISPSEDAPVAGELRVDEADFLLDPPDAGFDYVLANPPFLRYEEIPSAKRDRYRERFRAAEGRFDLFMPFVEQMLRLLADDGWLVFIAPEQLITSPHMASARKELRNETIHECEYLPKQVFPDHTITTVAVTVSPDRSLGADSSFYVTPLYGHETREMLERCGLQGDELEAAVDDYYEGLEMARKLLRFRRRWDGRDGGYKPAVDPTIPDQERQADLGRWSDAES